MTDTLTAPAPELDAEGAAQAKAWEELNPCPICEAHQHEGPEGTARTALHCWQCGFRPGQTVSVETLRAGVSETALAKAMADLRSSIVADLLEAMKSGETPTSVTLETPSGSVPILGQGAPPATDVPTQSAPAEPVPASPTEPPPAVI